MNISLRRSAMTLAAGALLLGLAGCAAPEATEPAETEMTRLEQALEQARADARSAEERARAAEARAADAASRADAAAARAEAAEAAAAEASERVDRMMRAGMRK